MRPRYYANGDNALLLSKKPIEPVAASQRGGVLLTSSGPWGSILQGCIEPEWACPISVYIADAKTNHRKGVKHADKLIKADVRFLQEHGFEVRSVTLSRDGDTTAVEALRAASLVWLSGGNTFELMSACLGAPQAMEALRQRVAAGSVCLISSSAGSIVLGTQSLVVYCIPLHCRDLCVCCGRCASCVCGPCSNCAWLSCRCLQW